MPTFKQFLERVNPDYLKGLKPAEKAEMKREIERFKKMKHDDPKAYPADWTADKKFKERRKRALPQSEHTRKFKQLYGESLNESNVDVALKNKSEKTGVPVKFLRQVWNRGAAAWRTGHRPGVSQHQWAHARVSSFLTGGPAREADKDIWEKAKRFMK